MKDIRSLYALLLVGYGLVVIGAIVFMAKTQEPERLDRELVKEILVFSAPIVAALAFMAQNTKRADEAVAKIEHKIEEAPAEIKKAAVVAKDTLETAAVAAAQNLINTASSLAREKKG